MDLPIKDLITPDEIIHAFLIKDSRYALLKFAKQNNISQSCVSQHIHGHRKNPKVLQEMANHLGCGVYGVMPINREAQPEPANEGRKK